MMVAAALALAAMAPEATPKDDFFSYLGGTWRVVSVDPSGGDDLHVCYRVEPFVGDKWISGVATSPTPGFESRDIWGRDEASGELMRTIFDSSGTYAVVRSRGWNGRTIILRGNAISRRGSMAVRETLRRISDNEFQATWEALRGGKWSAYAVETATRVPDGNCALA